MCMHCEFLNVYDHGFAVALISLSVYACIIAYHDFASMCFSVLSVYVHAL